MAVLLASVAMKAALAEEEEEEGPSETSVAMAATLLGSISFIMCLYYFINWPDMDIQQKTWETISNTISIFCAVLLFSAFNDLVEAYIINPIFGEGDATYGALLVDSVHLLIWFAIMQLSLAWLSGAAGPMAVDMEVFEKLSEEEQEKKKEAKECNMKCWAVLFAHICGFASINCFGTVQAVFFNSSPTSAIMTVPTAFVVMLILQRITDTIRTQQSLQGDGKANEFEELWDEETEEAENDVMGLSLSFTAIAAVRFSITGCLPNQEGKEEECKVEEYLFHHDSSQKMGLIGTGLAFAVLIFVVRAGWPESIEKKETEKIKDKSKRHQMELFSRLCEGVYVGIAMCFSWSMFYGIQMVLAGFHVFRGEDEFLSVSVAMVTFFIMMFGLIPLDSLADASWTGPKADRAIRSLMEAMALLIGFAWEQCFDTSVDALAEKSDGLTDDFPFINSHTTKMFLSLFCACLLVPAWKWYIIPFMLAKGWKFGYAFNFEQLAEVAKQMIEADDEEEEEVEEELSKKESKKVVSRKKADGKKLNKVLKVLEEVHADGRERVKGEVPELSAGSSYQALAGDDAEALRKKNAELISELNKAKAASLKAQQMLDNTMESMMSSMKHMHETVGRIEASA